MEYGRERVQEGGIRTDGLMDKRRWMVEGGREREREGRRQGVREGGG